MDGEILEVVVAVLVILSSLNLLAFHVHSMNELMKNEQEAIKIMRLFLLSDRLIASASYPVYGIVDCGRIRCEGCYVRCGDVVCGEPRGLKIRRFATDGKNIILMEVGE